MRGFLKKTERLVDSASLFSASLAAGVLLLLLSSRGLCRTLAPACDGRPLFLGSLTLPMSEGFSSAANRSFACFLSYASPDSFLFFPFLSLRLGLLRGVDPRKENQGHQKLQHLLQVQVQVRSPQHGQGIQRHHLQRRCRSALYSIYSLAHIIREKTLK